MLARFRGQQSPIIALSLSDGAMVLAKEAAEHARRNKQLVTMTCFILAFLYYLRTSTAIPTRTSLQNADIDSIEFVIDVKEETLAATIADEEKNEEEKKRIADLNDEQLFMVKPLPIPGGCPSRRFAVDNLLTNSECEQIKTFASRYLLKANVGDELSGANIHTIVEDESANTTAMDLLLDIRQRMHSTIVKHFTQEHPEDGGQMLPQFKAKQPLCIDYTHITARRQGNFAYSHGIHADNCRPTHIPGECIKNDEICCAWRDISALLYLNNQGEEFTGADFVFDKTPGCNEEQVFIVPKCGRMVFFTSGMENMHGVAQVLSGTRWAVASWYTFDCKAHSEQWVVDNWFRLHPKQI